MKHLLSLNDQGRPKKITKLAVSAEDETKYDYKYTLKCIGCQTVVDEPVWTDNIKKTITATINALSAKKQSELKQWEEESAKPCDHILNLKQEDAQVQGTALAHCKSCDLNSNLWLCLTCGNLGCGRAQYGGLGGNGHGMEHFEQTGHPVSVKMGSITPEGTADCFCYAHGDEILDPKLSEHLGRFGIQVDAQSKTEKSLAELQLEQNLKFDFSMTTDDGKELVPVFGPGLTGLTNLGNSCYLASVMQVMTSLDPFVERYLNGTRDHMNICKDFPPNCFHCQTGKLYQGLHSGKYAVESQDGVYPSMFKDVVGKGNPEFSSMRQQDAQEFLQHFLTIVEQKERALGRDPSKCLQFTTEQRIQCLECEGCRYIQSNNTLLTVPVPANVQEVKDGKKIYAPVDFQQAFGQLFESDIRDTLGFKTFPQYLFCTMSRFVLGDNWVLEKLNCPIHVPDTLDLDQYRSRGKQQEQEQPQFDQATLDTLLSMGFPENRCKKAILKTGNAGADAAMNWLFEHMEDPDIDAPLEQQTQDVDISGLLDMGFTPAQAKRALKETGNNMERAVDWLFSHPDLPPETEQQSVEVTDNKPAKYELFAFISHKGPSVHSGHYVACVKKGGWVLFNDNKVVQVPDIKKYSQEAYIYVYKRQ
ncbi:hypothetical protein EDD86DRAFT_244052 [Gorgonomyces haynaldii]|nr:hypothetical protein EDD86DRAFT_244052 [Gorgonomyces haynaldii]